jgi:hypothetical protein
VTTSRTLREVNQRVDDDQSPRPEDGPSEQESVVPLGLDEADSAELEHVTQALAALSFLRPDDQGSPADEPMPDWVWARISDSLAAEAAPRRRTPVWVRWGGGLVAASVAVLAVGLAVTSFSGGGDPTAIVAEGAPEAATAPLAQAMPKTAVDSARSVIAEPRKLSFAGMVPPALHLIDSQTDYSADQLAGQVKSVLQEMNMAPAQALTALKAAPIELVVPEPQPRGILLSAQQMRDCITKLTQLATSTALLIDWSTVDGQEAGVVVAPEYATERSTPDPTELDIWVVDHDCDVKALTHIRMP